MYLTEDVIGAAIGITYGKKGSLVTVVNDKRDLILVSGFDGIRFHVHPYQLSEEKVEKEKVEAVKPKKKK